jgi:hypothetical protein
MNAESFSDETLRLLERYDRDVAIAIDLVPDAELQGASGRYRDLRRHLDEPTIKRLMKEDGAAGQQKRPDRLPSEREQLLMRMLAFTNHPEARVVLERELAREQAQQELTILIAVADQSDDTELATQLAAQLTDVMGLARGPEQQVDDSEAIDNQVSPDGDAIGASAETPAAAEPVATSDRSGIWARMARRFGAKATS